MKLPASVSLDGQVRVILREILAGLRTSLRHRLVGVYLYGSLITGDFDPRVSDIDLVVVMSREPDTDDFEALDQLHQAIARRHPAWDDRLELAYISRAALKTFRQRSSVIGIISPGEPFHLIQAGEDWLISWYALREDGAALLGPPIQSLIDPIPLDDYLDAARAHIEAYRGLVADAPTKRFLSYIVLTVARGCYTLCQRQPTSKVKAADWAKRRRPRWAKLIDNALAWRLDPGCDSLTKAQIRPEVQAYVEDMLSRLESRRASDRP